MTGMSVGRRVCLFGSLALASLPRARAETYPARTITFIVPFTAGAAPDVFVRALAREVARQAGVSTLVENRPGAGSVLAAQGVARAAPDGYTVLVTGNVTMTGNPHVMRHLPYDPVRDFTPVAALSQGPMVLVVNPRKLPVSDVRALVTLLRRFPEQYSFGYASITSRLPAEVLQRATGTRLVAIPYRSGAAAGPDLISGQIDLLFTDFAVWPHVTSGRLRALAVTGAQRSPFAPELPSFGEAGISKMDITFWLAAYLPAGAIPALVSRLESMLFKAMQASDVVAALKLAGTTPFFLPARQLAGHQARELTAWGHIIRAAGIVPE